jgi:hypothetical protein
VKEQKRAYHRGKQPVLLLMGEEGETMPQDLTALLDGIRPGPVSDTTKFERLLAACWNDLDADHGGMEGYKLLGRMEEVEWKPPLLSFRIERHGGTVMGSSRAEVQHWEVDLEKKTATLAKTGHRQLRPMAKRIYIKPLVGQILAAVRSGKEDELVSWHDNGMVFVNTTTIFPKASAVRMTLESRRKRLSDAVASVVLKEGWDRLGPRCFRWKQCGGGQNANVRSDDGDL